MSCLVVGDAAVDPEVKDKTCTDLKQILDSHGVRGKKVGKYIPKAEIKGHANAVARAANLLIQNSVDQIIPIHQDSTRRLPNGREMANYKAVGGIIMVKEDDRDRALLVAKKVNDSMYFVRVRGIGTIFWDTDSRSRPSQGKLRVGQPVIDPRAIHIFNRVRNILNSKQGADL